MSLLNGAEVNGAFIFSVMFLVALLTLGRETRGASLFEEVNQECFSKDCVKNRCLDGLE